MKKFIAAFDQGTTSSRTIIFDYRGRIVSKGQTEFSQLYPKEGWVEHDPEDLFSSQLTSWKIALKKGNIKIEDIQAIGIANQRETTLVWDRYTGKPIYNAIVWQCRRTAEYCEKIKAKYGTLIYDHTGLQPDAYFSASKIRWLLDNVPYAAERAEKGELLFGTVDTYLIWRFTGGKVHATDYTNASRTMLFNIHTLTWDKDLLKLFGIPACMMPHVLPSGSDYGITSKKVLGAEIPICAAVGDQQGALFGHLCVKAGDIKNTYGTGCFLLMNTGDRAVQSKNGLLTTLTASLRKPSYALEGSVFIGGAVVQWLRDELGLIKSSSETEALAKSVSDTGGVSFVPAFVGLGAPHWNSECRGLIYGITRGTNKAHIVRAALESIAFQVFDVVRAMERDVRMNICRLNADGGASANNFLMQFQSDILGAEVAIPSVTEMTALGAAYLAGLYCGYFRDFEELRENCSATRMFCPEINDAQRAEKLKNWERALMTTLYKA